LSQPSFQVSSNSKALECAVNYIESFNSKNIKQLEEFFTLYYEYTDHERRLNIEKSLKKSWGELELIRVIYNSDYEIIILIQASKMPKSFLLFDIKIDENSQNKINYFARTGIPIPDNRNSSITDSEVLYFADRSIPIADTMIYQTVFDIAEAFKNNYYIPEIGGKISTKLIDNLHSGSYSQLSKAGRLADSILADILKIHFDSHSSVEVDRHLQTFDSLTGLSQNFGFETVEIMDKNIGYIKLNEFSSSKKAQDIAQQVFDTVRDCNSLILDLRNNVGGYPEMIQFVSGYFFLNPVIINTFYDRNGNIVDEMWTQDNIPGGCISDSVTVVILTSKQTASAAEGFVNLFMKTNRATILGESTNGAYHPSKEVVINSLFVVSIPFMRGDEINLPEGTGITPDIFVSSAKALEKAVEYLR
jgi:hypothetical protein